MWNVGAYTHGMMGQTPNIDHIAKEAMLFTDHYARPSCTAGRGAFITGQLPVRTGMTTIGIPGSTLGLQKEDPTLAEVLRPLGYATGQFGKNHLDDRNQFLPTVHGFDEFYGNLSHLNAEEEPEQLDYPGVKNPEFTKKFGPRGVLHARAADGEAAERPARCDDGTRRLCLPAARGHGRDRRSERRLQGCRSSVGPSVQGEGPTPLVVLAPVLRWKAYDTAAQSMAVCDGFLNQSRPTAPRAALAAQGGISNRRYVRAEKSAV